MARSKAHSLASGIVGLTLTMTSSACGSDPSTISQGSPTPLDSTAKTVTIEFKGGSIKAELATNEISWEKGLMDRTSMPHDAGMLFVFPVREARNFWMKDTLLPLSIAYMRRDGNTLTVRKILDMQPCKTDQCDYYPSGAADIDAALEVNLGWFAQAGVTEGDTALIKGDLGLAR